MKEADDLTVVSCRVTAVTNHPVEPSLSLATPPLSITREAPTASQALADQALSEQSGVRLVDASIDFQNALGGTFSLQSAPSGVSIDQNTGVVSHDTRLTGVLSQASVVVVYSNSGGTASSAYSLDVLSISDTSVYTAGASGTVWVATHGDDATAARNDPDRPYATLTGAWSAAMLGDTIKFAAGTYTHSGTVTLANKGATSEADRISIQPGDGVATGDDGVWDVAFRLDGDLHDASHIEIDNPYTSIVGIDIECRTTGGARGGAISATGLPNTRRADGTEITGNDGEIGIGWSAPLRGLWLCNNRMHGACVDLINLERVEQSLIAGNELDQTQSTGTGVHMTACRHVVCEWLDHIGRAGAKAGLQATGGSRDIEFRGVLSDWRPGDPARPAMVLGGVSTSGTQHPALPDGSGETPALPNHRANACVDARVESCVVLGDAAQDFRLEGCEGGVFRDCLGLSDGASAVSAFALGTADASEDSATAASTPSTFSTFAPPVHYDWDSRNNSFEDCEFNSQTADSDTKVFQTGAHLSGNVVTGTVVHPASGAEVWATKPQSAYGRAARTNTVAPALLVPASEPTSVFGNAVSVSFGASMGVSSTTRLGPINGGYANWIERTGTNFVASDLSDNTGTQTSLSLELAAGFGDGAPTSTSDDLSSEYDIFHSGIRCRSASSSTDTRFILRGLPWACDVIVIYDERAGAPTNSTYRFRDGHRTYYAESDQSGKWAGTWVENSSTSESASASTGNYVRFSGVTTPDLTITVEDLDSSHNVIVVGIQVIERTDLFLTPSSSEDGNVKTFDTVAAMAADSAALSAGETVLCVGRDAGGDGGGAIWIISSSGTADGHVVLNLGNGLFATLGKQSENQYDLRQAGAFAATSGAEVATKLRALFTHMSTRGGGELHLTENYDCHNIVFPPNVTEENAIWIRQKLWTKITPSDPIPGTFVWDFPTTGTGLSHVFFEGIYLRGAANFSTVCNGIRVGPINQGRMLDCRAHFIVGTAFYIAGYNNSRVDLSTFKCGQASSGRYAQVFTASAQKGNTCNDIVYEGATERDELGISFEGTHLLRTGSSIKLHGGDEVRRALRVLRCLGFDLEAICSQNWGANNNSEFIWIGDNGNVGTHGELPNELSSSVPQNTNGRLTINTMHNVSYQGTGTGNWCVVDLGTSPSQLKIEGLIRRQTGGAANIVQVESNQAGAVFINDSLSFDPAISSGNQTAGVAHQ